MHTVLCLIEYNRLLGLEYFVRNFHLVDAEFLCNLRADRRIRIVEGRQAVHKDRCILCHLHNLSIYLIFLKQVDPCLPYFIRLAHGHPDIGVDHICILRALFYILRQADLTAILCCDLSCGLYKRLLREQFLRRAGSKVRPILAQAIIRELPMLFLASPK